MNRVSAFNMRHIDNHLPLPALTLMLSALIMLLWFGTGCNRQNEQETATRDQASADLDTMAYLTGFDYRSADGVIVGEGVRLRSAPGLRSEVVDKVNTGMLVKYLRRSEHPVTIGAENPCHPDGNYWHEVITAHGRRGWVYGDFCYTILHPGRMSELMRYTADGIAPKLINRQYHFDGTVYRLGFALAKQNAHQTSLTEQQDTVCAELLIPFFYLDTARMVFPWHYKPNPQNALKAPHLATDLRFFQMAYGAHLTDRPAAFKMTDRELLFSIARTDQALDEPVIYTLRVTLKNQHFSAAPLDPGKELHPGNDPKRQ
jgi:hypothetical protein